MARPKSRRDRPRSGAERQDERGVRRQKLAEERAAKSSKFLLLRDAGAVLGVIIAVTVVLWVVLGTWPPMVVVESGSMMHGSDSAVGIIDTGDLTLVQAISSRTDVITWAQAKGNLRYSWVQNGEQMPEGLKHRGD